MWFGYSAAGAKKKYEQVQSAKNIGVYVKKLKFEGWQVHPLNYMCTRH